MELSIILPVYNEVENIGPLIDEIECVLAPLAGKYEIIAVDDGSTDGSRAAIERISREKLFVRGVFFRKNAGQSAAFDAGFRCAVGKVVITMDADRQNDPSDIIPMYSKITGGCDFVAGWRKNRRDNYFYRTVPSRIANALIKFVTRTKLHDMGCSLKAYRREIVSELRLYGEMHRFLSVMAENLSNRVEEYVVHHRPRVAGKSKYGIARTFKVILDLMTIWFIKGFQTKPVYVFGGVGIAMMTLGLCCAGFVLYQKFGLGVWVHRNPLFILAIITSMMGVQFLGLGIISELIIRTYFESQGKPAYIISSTIGFDQGVFSERVVEIRKKAA